MTLTYDARGLVASVKKGTATTTYKYDSLGQRMSKTLSTGVTTDFHYDVAGRLIAEFNPSTGATLREYVWLGQRPIMLIIPGTTEQRFHIYTDHSNTPVRMTNAAGTTVWQWQRDPFGSNVPSTSTVALNLRMPGQYYDAESGLHHNGARYYHPATGRYLQAVPLGEPGGTSAFTYADGDAVNLIDPTGLAADSGPVDRGILVPPTFTVTATRLPNFGFGNFVSASSFQNPYDFGASGGVFDPQGIGFTPPAEFLPPGFATNTAITGTDK
ncbi:MAG: RHS repeat-associated core domain-containing protein, partial [Planctomycetota bacterium]